ncbi:hypothetical protein PSI22_03400 [Xenorhabdus sp. XENO-7]|uniref:Carboxypeptidase regulatory-like domain-containing protein n=1 Tax=Xenorhabdus aichiensis TaxID=3025874 RepID=A0ABT5LZI3_9GAMM|nr:hypothetical protein [Xenorhabdus aichiensis]MDC9620702.1 hypothetical protein [Xenorhabdus aichiensis]
MVNTAKDIVNLKSLILHIDSPFISISQSSNNNTDEIYTKVTATIRDIHGKPLGGKKIFISDSSNSNLKKIKIYESNNRTEITTVSEKNYEGFFVKADKQGNVLFFIHPIKSENLILKLFSQILGDTKPIPADHAIYIVDHTLDEIPEKYPEPEILNFIEGDLISDGESKFLVRIPEYDNVQDGDYILFIVNNKYTGNVIQISGKSYLSKFFPLPYDIFEKEKDHFSYFSYIVIRALGDITKYKSRPLTLTYKGNQQNQPWADVIRIYDTCQVYSSYGIFPDSIVYDTVDDNTISQYKKTNDLAGLFVQITGTNDPNDSTKVALGSEVTLNLYINSKTGVIHWSRTRIMPYAAGNAGKNVELIFPIPHDLLKDRESYEDRSSMIYFDYQVGKDTDLNVTYGNIWQATIDTDIYS